MADTTNLTHMTIKASYWKLVSVISLSVTSLLTLAVLSRFLSPKQFGLVAAAQIITGFIGMFSDVGVSSALIQKKELTKDHIAVGFTTSVVLGISFCLILWVTAPYFSQILNIDISKNLVRALSLAFPISSFSSAPEALLVRNLDFRRLFFADLFSRILAYPFVSIWMALQGYGECSLVGGIIISSIIRSVYLLFINTAKLKVHIKKAEFLELFNFGGMYSILRIINYLVQKADSLVVGRFLGVATLGLYDRAFQLMSYPGMLIGNVLDGTMFPSMAIVQDQTERLRNAYHRSLRLVHTLLMPLSVFLILLSPEIVQVVLGSSWLELVVPLQIMFLVIPLRSSARMCDSLARAKGALLKNTYQKVLYLAAIILASLMGIKYGLVGVAIGVNLAVMIHFILMSSLGERLVEGDLFKVAGTFKTGLFYSIIVLLASGSVFIFRQRIENSLLILLLEIVINMAVFIFVLRLGPQNINSDLIWLSENLVNAIPNLKLRLNVGSVMRWMLNRY